MQRLLFLIGDPGSLKPLQASFLLDYDVRMSTAE